MADNKLDGKNVLLVVPQTQFREEEVFEPKRILEGYGAHVVIASTNVTLCRGIREGVIQSEILIADVSPDDYDAIVLSGGASVPEFFWKDETLTNLVSAMGVAKKLIAAISLSTVIIAKANLLEGRVATVYFLPEAIEELKKAGARYIREKLIIEDNIIMAEGPQEANRFAEAIATELAS